MATPAPATLSDAILAVETTQAALDGASGASTQAQSRFDSAKLALDAAAAALVQATTDFNSALDALIAAATAAKR